MLTQTLQLNLDEYSDLIQSVLGENFRKGLSDRIINELKLSDAELITFCLELACVHLFILQKSFQIKKQFITEDTKKLMDDALYSLFAGLQGDSIQRENAAKCRRLYRARYELLNSICDNIVDKDDKKREADIIGLARYLVSKIREEEKSVKAIESVGVHLLMSQGVLLKLIKKTLLDRRMMGRTTFVVAK